MTKPQLVQGANRSGFQKQSSGDFCEDLLPNALASRRPFLHPIKGVRSHNCRNGFVTQASRGILQITKAAGQSASDESKAQLLVAILRNELKRSIATTFFICYDNFAAWKSHPSINMVKGFSFLPAAF